MADIYNTGNPLGSNNLRDLSDNAVHFDEAMNSPLPSFPDRFGLRRQTWAGMEAAFQDFLVNMGYEPIHLTYVNGSPLTVDRPTQLIDRAGITYRVKQPASFPVNLTGTWATDAALLVELDNDVLQQELAEKYDATMGTALIGHNGRTLRDALSDHVNAMDYMFSNGLPQTQTQALQAALTAACNAGKALRIPAGVWQIGAKITSAGKSVKIFGDGIGITTVAFTAADGGFSLSLDQQLNGTPPDQAMVTGFTIESRADVTSPALEVKSPVYQPNAQGMAWLSNLNISRKADGTGTFTAGIQLDKIIGAILTGIIIVGDEARNSLYGIHLLDCLEVNFTDVKVTRYREGWRIRTTGTTDQQQTEGVFCNSCWAYDLYRGVWAPDQLIHFNWIGGFINPNGGNPAAPAGQKAEVGISIGNGAQCTVSEALIYVGGTASDAANQDGIRILGRGGNTIVNNRIVGVTKANARYGVLVNGGSSYNRISFNNISSFYDTGINAVDSSAMGNLLEMNNFFDCAALIASNSTNVQQGNTSVTTTGQPAVPVDMLRWGVQTPVQGAIGATAQWGCLIWPYAGANGDLGICDSTGAALISLKVGRVGMVLPTAATGLLSGQLWRDPAAGNVIKMVV